LTLLGYKIKEGWMSWSYSTHREEKDIQNCFVTQCEVKSLLGNPKR